MCASLQETWVQSNREVYPLLAALKKSRQLSLTAHG
jgi:hypothetical protein